VRKEARVVGDGWFMKFKDGQEEWVSTAEIKLGRFMWDYKKAFEIAKGDSFKYKVPFKGQDFDHLHLENYVITHARIVTEDGYHHFVQLLLAKENVPRRNRILQLDWTGFFDMNEKTGSRLEVNISEVVEGEVGSGRLAGMQQVHKNARKWKLFEFLKEVVDPTRIRYKLTGCKIFGKIPLASERKKWTNARLRSRRKTVSANCIAYSNYICKHLGFKKNTWKCTKNAFFG